MKFDEWNSFKPGDWCSEVNVRDFIQKITHHIQETQIFYQMQLIKQKNFGIMF